MDVYLAESPARLEETVQSLYADEQPKKRIRSKMETHSKLAETVGIENTIMLNPEDLAKVATRSENEESMNRDYNKNFGIQRSGPYGHNLTRRRGPVSGMRRQQYESSDSVKEIPNSTSLPETRTSVIRAMLNNRSKNRTENDAMSETDMEAIEYNSLRCFEQVDKDSGENFSRHRHYLRDNDMNIVDASTTKSDNNVHVSENFSRVPISSNRSFQMSSMETRPSAQPYFSQQVREAAYRVQQHPPEFALSQLDSRGKQYYDRSTRMPAQVTASPMIQKGYGGFNPKFNIQDASFADIQSGYRAGGGIYENRIPVTSESSAKQSLPAAEKDALKANVKSYPSPMGKSNEEEKSTKLSSVEQEITNQGKSNERKDAKQLDDHKNIKGKRGTGAKGDANNQCAQCLKKFASSSALAKHKATHSDERKYICPICEKGFKRQDHLNGHMMTHRDKKPYECKYCDKSYCDHRSLKRHYENYHPNPERVQPVTTSTASHKTESELLSFVKPEGRFTPDREEGRPSPLSSQSKQEVPQVNFRRKRNSDSMCSNSSDDQSRRPDSHSPHMLFNEPQSAVSMLKQVIDSHEHKKEKYPLEGGYPRTGYYPYPEGFNHQQWIHPYQAAQMMKIMQLNQPPILVQHGHLNQINPYCPTDPPQLVPNYPPVKHNPSSHASEATTDDSSWTSGRNSDDRGYKGNKDFVVPTDPTSIAIANAKDQQGDDHRIVQFTEGSRGFPHMVQWKTVSVGKDSNGMPPRSMGNNPGTMQLPPNMIVPDHNVKRERPTELNIHIPSSQAEKRPHEMVTNNEHQAKRHCPPPPSPASVNMAKEGLLKLADVSLRTDNSNNDDNVFKNPPSTPPRKPRHRPDPINISCSNLQFGGSVSPPIYTPPPMLSPHSIFHTPRCSASTPLTPSRFFLAGSRSRKNSLEDDSAEVPSEIMPEPKINIGPGFQAEVPSTTEHREETIYDKHRAAVCWIPFEQETRKRAQEIEAFLDMACSVAVFGGGSNKEYALHLLYRLNGNIKLAVRHILANKSAIQKGDGLADYHYEGSERWSSKERLKFREALDKNGKNFYLVSKEIKTKTVQQCVEFYYLWKACRPEGMRSRRGYTETESEHENEEEFSDNDSEATYVFECDFPECNSKFISRQALNGHIRVHGGSFMKPSEPKRTKVKVTASSDGSASSVSVSTNANRAVAKPPKPTKPPSSNSSTQPIPNGDGTLPEFPCKVCGRVFPKIKSRSAHMKTHVKRNDDDHIKSSK